MLSSSVSEFMERGGQFYVDGPDDKMDAETYVFYSRALEEAGQWLRKVLEAEVKEQGYIRAEATIRFPLGDLHVSVGCSVNFSLRGKDCGVRVTEEGSIPELYVTPIGDIDHYTYKAILEKDNPVKELIDFFSAGCLVVDATMERPVREKGTKLIDNDLLDEYKYCDPVGMHQMTPAYYDLARFFAGDYYY